MKSADVTRINNEQQLIEQACQGNTYAFEQLYRCHHQRIYALCFRLAGQQALAEEMTQECFIRAWEKLSQFRAESEFSTWLHRLSVNQALAMLKKQRSLWARFISHDTNVPQATQTADTLLLEKQISKLPEKARIVFVLFAIEGYSHEEIAALMHTRIGTSKAQLHRARALLKEMLS